MKSSPIYNIINVEGRASNRSFGADTSFTQDIRVGTSKSNSHTLADLSVEKVLTDDGRVEFVLFLDGLPIKKGTLDGKDFSLKSVDRIVCNNLSLRVPDFPKGFDANVKAKS